MDQVVYVLANVAYYLLSAIEIMLFLRAILSWFMTEENSFMHILVCMTEPILLPFRALLERSEKMRSLPIDFSLTFAMLAVILLQTLLTALL